MFCLLVVLAKLSVLAKWLARKTALRKPNRGEKIVSRKTRPKSAYDFLGLLYCFVVLLCVCVVFWPCMIYFLTNMARYSLFVLKVPLNNRQTKKQVTYLCYSVTKRQATNQPSPASRLWFGWEMCRLPTRPLADADLQNFFVSAVILIFGRWKLADVDWGVSCSLMRILFSDKRKR